MRYLIPILFVFLSNSLSADYLVKYYEDHFRCATSYYYTVNNLHFISSIDSADYTADMSFVPIDGYVADGTYCLPATQSETESTFGLTDSEFSFLMALTAVLFFTMLFNAITTLFTRS